MKEGAAILIESGRRHLIQDESATWMFSTPTNLTDLAKFVLTSSNESALESFAKSTLYQTFDNYQKILVAKDRNLATKPQDVYETLNALYQQHSDKGLTIVGSLIIDEQGDLCLKNDKFNIHLMDISVDPRLVIKGRKRVYRFDVEKLNGRDCITFGTVKIRQRDTVMAEAQPADVNPFAVLDQLDEADLMGVKAFLELSSETKPFAHNPKSQRINGIRFEFDKDRIEIVSSASAVVDDDDGEDIETPAPIPHVIRKSPRSTASDRPQAPVKAKPIPITKRTISSIDDIILDETRAFRVCQFISACCKHLLMSFRFITRIVDGSVVPAADSVLSCANLSELSHIV
jgi:hypothetical protein